MENRFVGMKSRGVYETPGGTILLAAHRGIESITLDREAAHLKDSLMPRYAELIYNGFWFSPERRMLQALIDESQHSVTGRVRLKLYKGNVTCIGRESPNSLYSMKVVTFEDDQGAYDQFDAQGFIKLNALRLRLGAAGRAARRGAVGKGRGGSSSTPGAIERDDTSAAAFSPPLAGGEKAATSGSRPFARSPSSAPWPCLPSPAVAFHD